MDTREIEATIRRLAGTTVFSAEFVKKDGTLRHITCRLQVKKGVTGKGMAYSPAEKKLLTVFDMEKDGFRMIALDTIKKITIRGQEYKIHD